MTRNNIRDAGDALDQSVMGFQDFMQATPSRHWEWTSGSQEGEDSEYLGYFLRKWLEIGDGVELTGGSYKHYLRTCIAVADMCMAGTWDPRFDDNSVEPPVYRDRTIKRIETEEDPYVRPYADEMLYNLIAYRRLHGLVEDQLTAIASGTS